MNTLHAFNRLSQFLDAFAVLSPQDLRTLVQLFKPVYTKRNHLVASSAETNQRLYFVADGLLRQYSSLPAKHQQDAIIDRGFVLSSHFCLSASSFGQTKTQLIHSETIKRTFLLYINKSQLDALFVQIPALQALFSQLMQHYFFEMERLNCILHMPNGQMRYEYYCHYFSKQVKEVPDKYIALFLHISPSELSRIRSRISKGHQLMAFSPPSLFD
jgi:CRP/FNR family transcriptional regulator